MTGHSKPETRKSKRSARRARERGFTLIEMLIVISIIAILLSVAVPQYQKAIIVSREAVLRDDLFTMRNSIEQYTLDKQKAPQDLNDLVSAGYLKSLPVDPITRANNTWEAQQCSELMSVDQTEAGICDVHSGAGGMGTDGTPYNTW